MEISGCACVKKKQLTFGREKSELEARYINAARTITCA